VGDRAFDQKLRTKLLTRVLVAATVVLVALALVTFLVTRELLAREVSARARYRVELATAEIDGWLHEKGEVLRGLAAREALAPMDDAARRAHFRALAAAYGGVGSVYMGFADGRFITGSDWVPPADYDPRRRPWYTEAVAAGRLTYSTPYRDLDTGKLVVSVAAPLGARDAPTAVIAMDVLVDDVLVAAQRLADDGTWAYVVDGAGLIIAHPDRALVLAARVTDTADAALFARQRAATGAGAPQVVVAQGRDYVATRVVAETGWHVFFHVPSSQVTGPLRRLAVVFVVGILAALAVLAVTTLVISARIVKPLLRLVDGARRLARGTYDARVPVESRDEVGYLSHSFNDMAAGLAEREFIKSVFGRYVSADVAREILDGKIALGGESKRLTIMFCDIRGFTSLSEAIDPHALVGLLNRYFTRMDAAIAGCGGSINKYLGDGILAIFGAPAPLADDARAAADAAREMMRQLAVLNEEQGTSLGIGIGLHTGSAVVGNIGSEQRTEYTVIGDAVNLTSRIESLCALYGQPILASEAAAEGLGDDYLVRVIDRVRVKGRTSSITLVAPLWRADVSATEAERVARANQVMADYLAGEFERALAGLDELAGQLDRHLQLIGERCRACLAARPEAWDGVWQLQAK
jgi:class 3 adenylate cyclase